MNESAIKLFNESDVFASLMIFENSSNYIYGDKEQTYNIGMIKDIAYRVIPVNKILDNDFYQIEFNKIDGYLSVKNIESVLLLSKERIQVKMEESLDLDNPLNNDLRINDKVSKLIENKICYSSHYAIYNNVLYEGIMFKGEVVAFVTSKHFTILHRLMKPFQIIEDTKTYKESNLINELHSISATSETFQSQYFYWDKDSIRFKYKGNNQWLPAKKTDLKIEIDEFVPTNPSDALLKSIVYQYENKIQKAQQYYFKILKQELKRLR